MPWQAALRPAPDRPVYIHSFFLLRSRVHLAPAAAIGLLRQQPPRQDLQRRRERAPASPLSPAEKSLRRFFFPSHNTSARYLRGWRCPLDYPCAVLMKTSYSGLQDGSIVPVSQSSEEHHGTFSILGPEYSTGIMHPLADGLPPLRLPAPSKVREEPGGPGGREPPR